MKFYSTSIGYVCFQELKMFTQFDFFFIIQQNGKENREKKINEIERGFFTRPELTLPGTL